MLLLSALLAVIPAQLDGRVIFHRGPLPGEPDLVLSTGAPTHVSVNDRHQVAALVSIAPQNTPTPSGCNAAGAAVVVEDHGTYTTVLCPGTMVGGVAIVSFGAFMTQTSGILADNGTVGIGARVGTFPGTPAIVRASLTAKEIVAHQGDLDEMGVPFAFNTNDELRISASGALAFTSGNHTRIYLAPAGGAARLCTSALYVGGAIVTDDSVFYQANPGGGASRCKVMSNDVVVDQPFGDGATLPGSTAGLDSFAISPVGGGRGGLGMTASKSTTTYLWAGTASSMNLVLSNNLFSVLKAVSFDGSKTAYSIRDSSSVTTWRSAGALIWTETDPLPGSMRYFLYSSTFLGIGNEGTVWFFGHTVPTPGSGSIESGISVFRWNPGGALEKVLIAGDTLNVAGTTQTILNIQDDFTSTGGPNDNGMPAVNGAGAAVVSANLSIGQDYAVILLGEPPVPDLQPIAQSIVGGVEAPAKVGAPFTLRIGVKNSGTGDAQATLDASFLTGVLYSGADPTACTTTRVGANTLSTLSCDAAAFGILSAGQSAYVDLVGAKFADQTDPSMPAIVHVEVRESFGASEVNTANNIQDLQIPLAKAQTSLEVLLLYAIVNDALLGTVNINNAGPDDARDIVVVVPGLPTPNTLPAECDTNLSCHVASVPAGMSHSFTINFGLPPQSAARAPFTPMVSAATEDPNGATVTVSGDPSELLKTDLKITMGDATGDQNLVLLIENISEVTANEATLELDGIVPDAIRNCSSTTGQVVCPLGDLAPGASRMMSFNISQPATMTVLAVAGSSRFDRDETNNRLDLSLYLGLKQGDAAEKNKKGGCSSVRIEKGSSDLWPFALLLFGLWVRRIKAREKLQAGHSGRRMEGVISSSAR